MVTEKASQSTKHEPALHALNIAPYREGRSSQVLSAPLPATTTHLSDSSSPDRSRSLALSLSLALSPTLCLPLATSLRVSPRSHTRNVSSRYSAPPACNPLPLHLLYIASSTPPLSLALAAASRTDRSLSASRSLCNWSNTDWAKEASEIKSLLAKNQNNKCK